MYQTESSGSTTRISDPNLKPEKVLAKELSAEGALGRGVLRASIFEEIVRDALYSFTDYSNVSRNQNIDKLRARGVELAYTVPEIVRGLDVTASLTHVRSKVLENALNPSSVGKWVIRVPDWRATLFAVYRLDEHWSGSLGYKYSGQPIQQPRITQTSGRIPMAATAEVLDFRCQGLVSRQQTRRGERRGG